MTTSSQEARRALTEQRGAELDKWWAINFLRYMNFLDPISPTLSDMPTEILDQVLEKLKPVDQLTSRKICRRLRAAVVQNGISFDSISFWVWDGRVEMMLNDLQIFYTDDANGNSIVKHNEIKRIIKGENFMQLAFKDLETMLKHAGKFEFAIFGGEKHAIATHLLSVLNSKKCVHFEEISITLVSLSDIISILQYCNSRTLENIELWCHDTNEHFEQLAQLEQWKNSKECAIYGSLFDNMPIKHLLHFEFIDVGMHKFSLQKLIEIRHYLLRRNTFQHCTFAFNDADPIEVARVFDPHYSGGDEYKFVYLRDDRKYVIKCRKNDGMSGWELVIHRRWP